MKKSTKIIVVISCVCLLCSVLLVNCFAIIGGSQNPANGGYLTGICAELGEEFVDRNDLYGVVFPFMNIPVNQSNALDQNLFDDQYTQVRLNYSYTGSGDFVYDVFTWADGERTVSSYEIAQIESPVGENDITDGSRVFDTIRFNYVGVPLAGFGLGFGNEFVSIEGPTDVPPEFYLRFDIRVPVTIVVEFVDGTANNATRAVTSDLIVSGEALVLNPGSNSGTSVFDADAYDFVSLNYDWLGEVYSIASADIPNSRLGDLISRERLVQLLSDGAFSNRQYEVVDFGSVALMNAIVDGELVVSGGDGVLPTDFIVISGDFNCYSGYVSAPVEITEEIVVEEVHYDKVEPLEWLFQAGQGVLDMELFGSLTIGHLLLVAIAVPALLAILRAIAGG